MSPNRIRFRLVPLAAVVLGGILSAPGQVFAVAFTKADLPTFYQHQLAPNNAAGAPAAAPASPNYDLTTNWWEGNGVGWCATTAFVDSLYYWDKNGLSGLFDHSNLGGANVGKTQLERFVYSNSDLALEAGGCASASQVVAYLDNHAGAANAATAQYGYVNNLVMMDYRYVGGKVVAATVTAAGTGAFTDTGYTSMFDFYYDTVRNPYKTINIRITGTDPAWWWAGSFHVLDGAGVETTKGKDGLSDMWFSDPDVGKNNLAGWNQRYDNTDPLPIGNPAAAPYLPYQSGRFDATGTFTAGLYDKAVISDFYVLVGTVPEPSSAVLTAAGLALAAGLRRRRLRSR